MNKQVVIYLTMKFIQLSTTILTGSCTTFFHDNVLKGFDKGLMTRMILIDLQKEFDKIHPDILLKKIVLLVSQIDQLVGLNHTFQIDCLV